MRIDGPNPIAPAHSETGVREVKPVPRVQPAPVVEDHLEKQPKPEVSPTNVVVEMRPGNIVVYKFVDEASGRLIEQIPAEQMLDLSTGGEVPKKED